MKEKFLILIPHAFSLENIEKSIETTDISIYQCEETLENVEERLISMSVAGYFDSFIIVPINELESINSLECLERSILNHRMENLQS